MSKILIVIALLLVFLPALSQDKLPIFTNEALVKSDSSVHLQTGEYTLLVYGAIGCSYSQYLVANLNAFDPCENIEIVIVLNDSKDSI